MGEQPFIAPARPSAIRVAYRSPPLRRDGRRLYPARRIGAAIPRPHRPFHWPFPTLSTEVSWRNCFVGDIQGCYDDLRRLCWILPNSTPTRTRSGCVATWSPADPDSSTPLRFVKSLGSRAVTVLGSRPALAGGGSWVALSRRRTSCRPDGGPGSGRAAGVAAPPPRWRSTRICPS